MVIDLLKPLPLLFPSITCPLCLQLVQASMSLDMSSQCGLPVFDNLRWMLFMATQGTCNDHRRRLRRGMSSTHLKLRQVGQGQWSILTMIVIMRDLLLVGLTAAWFTTSTIHQPLVWRKCRDQWKSSGCPVFDRWAIRTSCPETRCPEFQVSALSKLELSV